MKFPPQDATVELLAGEDVDEILDGYRLTRDGRWVVDPGGHRLAAGEESRPISEHGDVMATITFTADVTGIHMTGREDAEPRSYTAWRVRFDSGRGALIVWLDAIAMSDILSDSGIEEAGDIREIKVRPSTWQPRRLLSKVYAQRRGGTLYVNDGSSDGPEALLRLEDIQHSTPLPRGKQRTGFCSSMVSNG